MRPSVTQSKAWTPTGNEITHQHLLLGEPEQTMPGPFKCPSLGQAIQQLDPFWPATSHGSSCKGFGRQARQGGSQTTRRGHLNTGVQDHPPSLKDSCQMLLPATLTILPITLVWLAPDSELGWTSFPHCTGAWTHRNLSH